MEEKKEKSGGCCSCEADFRQEVKSLEDQAKAPTKAEHDEKRDELDAAFKESENR